MGACSQWPYIHKNEAQLRPSLSARALPAGTGELRPLGANPPATKSRWALCRTLSFGRHHLQGPRGERYGMCKGVQRLRKSLRETKFRREQVFNRIQHLPDQINIDTSVAFAVKFDRAVPKMGQNEPFGLQLDHELAKTRPSCVSIRE